jgi:hypothetical protein
MQQKQGNLINGANKTTSACPDYKTGLSRKKLPDEANDRFFLAQGLMNYALMMHLSRAQSFSVE